MIGLATVAKTWRAPTETRKAFNPDQPRDETGKWTSEFGPRWKKFRATDAQSQMMSDWTDVSDNYDRLRTSPGFEQLLRKLPQGSGTLWRGANLKPGDLAKLKVGSTLSIKKLTSAASAGEGVAIGYTNFDFGQNLPKNVVPVVYKFEGAVGTDLAKADVGNPAVGEVIMSRGQSFKVALVERGVTGTATFPPDEPGARVKFTRVTLRRA